MINYILIVLAVVCFAVQFAFTKIYESKIKQTLSTGLVLVTLTSIVGFLLYLCIGGFTVEFSTYSFGMALAMAVIMLPYYIVSIKVLSLGSLAVYSMFMMLGGMLVPFLYGISFLSEEVTWGKIVGCIILTGSMILQACGQEQQTKNGKSDKTENVRKAKFLILCVLIFIINGLTGVIAKAHQIHQEAINEISFTVLSCGLTAILSGVFLIIMFLKKDDLQKSKEIKTTLSYMPLIIMALIGAATYTGNFLHLKAASFVPASVQFPIVSGGVIVLSSLTSAIIFKERVSKREWIAVVGALLSTFLFMF